MIAYPSFLLLAWTGLAATLAAALIIAPMTGAKGPRGSVYFFRPAGIRDGLLLVISGIVLYPVIYGAIFDFAHNATVLSGAAVGAVHGALLVIAAGLRRKKPVKPGLTIILYVVYGAVVGFLYVTA